MDYYFEEVQPLRIEVYDIDDVVHMTDLSRHDFIGAVEVTLAEIVSAGQELRKRLQNPRELVCIVVCLCQLYDII